MSSDGERCARPFADAARLRADGTADEVGEFRQVLLRGVAGVDVLREAEALHQGLVVGLVARGVDAHEHRDVAFDLLRLGDFFELLLHVLDAHLRADVLAVRDEERNRVHSVALANEIRAISVARPDAGIHRIEKNRAAAGRDGLVGIRIDAGEQHEAVLLAHRRAEADAANQKILGSRTFLAGLDGRLDALVDFLLEAGDGVRNVAADENERVFRRPQLVRTHRRVVETPDGALDHVFVLQQTRHGLLPLGN